MRISGIPSNPFYWRNTFERCPAVILDGAWVGHVVTADDVEGVVEIVRYRDGAPKRDASGEYILTKVLRGRVEIVGVKRGDPIH